jgi:hypothetical protein
METRFSRVLRPLVRLDLFDRNKMERLNKSTEKKGKKQTHGIT